MAILHQVAPASVVSAATYFPSARSNGRRPLSMPHGDEDAVTMAVEAVRELLVGTVGVQALYVSLNDPDLDGIQPAETIRLALGLSDDVRPNIVRGDDLGALAQLEAALDAVRLGRVASAVVVAAERGDGKTVGAAAAAVRIADSAAGVIVEVGASLGRPIASAWVGSEGTQRNELRYLESTYADWWSSIEDQEQASTVVTGLTPRGGTNDAGKLRSVGSWGVAGPLLALLAASADQVARRAAPAGESVDVVCVGGTRVARVRVSGRLDAFELTWPDLSRPLAADPRVDPRLSLPGSSPFYARAARELLAAEAARCRDCGFRVYPPGQRPVCPDCGASSWEPYELSRHGTIYSFTVNRFLPVGFGDQMLMVLAELDDGMRYWAPGVGFDLGTVGIGDVVEMHLRRFTGHEGVPIYAMKFTPAPSQENHSSVGGRDVE